MLLSNEEMITTYGGAITANILNAVSRAVSTVLNLGQLTGSAIRRIFTKNYC